MKHLHLMTISAVLVFCTTAASIASTLTFVTEEDYNSLIKTGRTSISSYSATGGIGNSESIAIVSTNGSNAALYMTASDRLSSTSPITLSLNFKWVTPTGGGIGGQSFTLGFGRNEGGATLTPYTSAFSEATTGANREEIYVGLKSGGPGSNTVTLTGGTVSNLQNTSLPGLPATTAGLTSEGWYFFTATFTPNSEETGFGISYTLYHVDPITGEFIGAALLKNDIDVAYAGVFADSVNPFMSIRASTWSGASAIDNLTFTGSVIPEPSTVAALLSGSLLLIGMRFRRRNKLSA